MSDQKLRGVNRNLTSYGDPAFSRYLRGAFWDDFDVIVDATHTKILKPDPRAYQTCLEALNLPAAACVFVDDQRRNVDGARAIGLETVHFDVADPAAGYTKALNLLGLTEEISA